MKRLVLFLCVLLLLSCGGGGGGGGTSPSGPSITVQAEPVANVVAPQSTSLGTSVTLDGSASSAANSNALTFAWTLTSKPVGSSATLSSPSLANATLVPDVAGGYTATLVVNDGHLSSSPSTVTIAVSAQASCASISSSCSGALFIDAITEPSWFNIDVTASQGTSGLRDALVLARDSHPNQPVRIRLAPGNYADNLGAEVFVQHMLRTSSTPVYIVASNPAANATQLGQGLNFLAVAYIAIDGVTIGPSSVGAWNNGTHSLPLPLQASAGIHVAGAALLANQNANSGGTLNKAIYGQYQPSHHIIVRNVTIQNLFELDALDGETSNGQGMDGMKFNQVEDLWVSGSTVTQTSRHGIDNVGVHRATFSNNVISHTGGGLGLEAKGGSVDVTVEGNTFYRVRRVTLGGENTDAAYYYSADGRWDYEALRSIARNNLILDPREAGLEFSGCADCSAVGNTIAFSPSYQVPIDQGTVFGGDAIRVHDSMIVGTEDGAGSDCQFWNGSDYVTVDPCWGVGSNAPAPIRKILRTSNVTMVDNVIASVNATFSTALGGSTIPCPLNVIDGTADLHFDANYWWNGNRPLPNAGCSNLPEGSHSIYSTAVPMPSPGFIIELDDSSISALASSAIRSLTPKATSSVVGVGVAHSNLGSTDRAGHTRKNPPSMGALEP